ncbi:phospholipase/carboxylesterase [Kribbella steppae]|uniref:Phospholipase/carboxylesterase n=1 Tax=Kribbella steppae TaxID=2512223 RepID=A0A4R2HGN0_9ACTN|nr:phospholipase [Kribbella steppae]TCO28039.1 phospholipase/carboxylesterase [Kribbella steppae]
MAFLTTPENPHLASTPVLYGAPLAEAALVVYAVHGRGQGPGFMAEQADRVDLPGVAWLAPQADADTWYPQSFLAPLEQNQPRLDHALSMVRSHLADLGRLGWPQRDVVLFGFSQGACLLSEYLLRDQPPCAGAFIHTGGYLGPEDRPRAAVQGSGLPGTEIVLLCAEDDEFVPLTRVEKTAGAFASLGARIELTTYDDPVHHLNDDSIARLRRMLRSRLLERVEVITDPDHDN